MKDWMETLLLILAICAYLFVGVVITVMIAGEPSWLAAVCWPFIFVIWLLALLVKAAIDLGLYLRMLWF